MPFFATLTKWRDLSLRAKGLVVVAGPVAATIISTILFFITRQAHDAASGWVMHTIEVKQEAQALLTQVVESEATMRGYPSC